MTGTDDLIPLWCDLSHLGTEARDRLSQVMQTPVSGVLLTPAQLPEARLPARVRTAVLVEDVSRLEGLDRDRPLTVVSRTPSGLDQMPPAWERGLWVSVDDAASMNEAVAALDHVDVLIISFADETNIPLELVIAEAQSRSTTVVKLVNSIPDALVTRGVLQHGPDAMLLRVSTTAEIDELASVLVDRQTERLDLVAAPVVAVRSVGMGMRGCVDAATLFEPDEGILVGSTSAGGLLVCAEVHYLPYMNLRPFRVNAGAVHSYVWTPGGRTAYITDLAAGERVLAVTTTGRARPVIVGRVKIEMRPLRLIACQVGDALLNVVVQDDWHVRLFDAEGEVRNITTITPGDRLLALPATPGRHVGIAVSESIVEV